MEAALVSTEWIDKQWGAYFTLIGVTGTAIGTGKTNTATVATWLNANGEFDRAAQLCDNLVFGGKDDWFLPSKDELNLMYTYLKLNGVGGFANVEYWSSSEDDDRYAWFQDFDHLGPQSIAPKPNYRRVRAVRQF